jgi:peptide/nickel transport system substrate-binding protein
LGGTLEVVEPGKGAVFPNAYLALSTDFDPQRSYWGDAWELFRCCLLRTLMSYDVSPGTKRQAEVFPDLAERFPKVSADGLTWTFRLKSGLHYGPPLQNTPIVARDVIRALERMGDPKVVPQATGGYAHYYSVIRGFDDFRSGRAANISGLVAPDDRTLIIHLTRPAGDLPNLLAMPGAAPIPPNPFHPDAPDGVATGHRTHGSYLVASGPYMLEGSQDLDFSVRPENQKPVTGFVPGKEVTLVRNPSWIRASDNLRGAYVDRIHVTIGGTRQNAARTLATGRADLILESLADFRPLYQRYLQDPARAGRVHLDTGNGLAFIGMNLATPPFDDVHIRRAVSYAIDRARLTQLTEQLKNTIWTPFSRVATHLAPDSMENGLLLQFNPYATPGGHGSVRLARREMARSRYDNDGDGVCDAPACRNIVAPSLDLVFDRAGVADVRRNLQAIGLDVRPQVIGLSEFLAKMGDPRAHVRLYLGVIWQSDFPNGSTFFIPLLSSDALQSLNQSLVGASPAQLRTWGYHVTRVPSVDDRIARCETEVGHGQISCWAELDKFVTQDVVPWVPYDVSEVGYAVSKRVVRYAFDQFGLTPALDQLALAGGSSRSFS